MRRAFFNCHLDILGVVQVFSILMILYLLFVDRGVLKLPIITGFAYVFFLFFQFLLCVFWKSLIGCIYIKHCCIFLMKGPICYYGRFFFIPGNILFFWNMCCLVLMQPATAAFFLIFTLSVFNILFSKIFLTASLRYSLHTFHFIHLMYTIQWL